jgi:type IV pilus assembly protein PilQ
MIRKQLVPSLFISTALVTCLSTTTAMAATTISGRHTMAPAAHIKTAKQDQKNITLNFQNIETRKLLQILAQFSHSNFVLSDNVKGNMSIHLKDIPFEQALNVILQSQGLSRQDIGKVTIIGPIDQMAARRIKELEAHQKIEQLEPQESVLIHLNYAKAQNVVGMIKKKGLTVLSTRGEVSYDARTNSIWVKDTAKRVAEIKKLVKRLDKPVKQVEIEARLVSIDTPYQKEFGVKLGLTSGKNLSGTLKGANQLATGSGADGITPFTDRLNFNLPATSLFKNPASIGMALARIGNTYLDLELSAMEKEGHGTIIGSPRVVISDQHEAHIQIGEEIPYQSSTSSGATAIEFKKATLALTVTPQITPDNRVILDITVKRDKVSTNTIILPTGTVVPIDTEEENSQILLNNNQTVVLGGIMTDSKSKIVVGVPFLSKIPLLGHLFRHTQIDNDKNELLIFITPRIITRPSQLSTPPPRATNI